MSLDELDSSRLLITGANGAVGSFFSQGIKLSHEQLDITSSENFKNATTQFKPSAIIHLAGLDIRKCEANPKLAEKVNFNSTYNLIESAKLFNIPVVFLSSGAVFNGNSDMQFSESDQPNPQNLYAELKVKSENLLLNEYKQNTIIVRTGWVFGSKQQKHNKFVEGTCEKAKKNETIFANSSQFGSPTYALDLMKEIIRIVGQKNRGVFHVTNSGRANAWNIADEIIKLKQSRSSIEEYKAPASDNLIKRSLSEVLASSKVKLRPWQDALKEYLHAKNP